MKSKELPRKISANLNAYFDVFFEEKKICFWTFWFHEIFFLDFPRRSRVLKSDFDSFHQSANPIAYFDIFLKKIPAFGHFPLGFSWSFSQDFSWPRLNSSFVWLSVRITGSEWWLERSESLCTFLEEKYQSLNIFVSREFSWLWTCDQRSCSFLFHEIFPGCEVLRPFYTAPLIFVLTRNILRLCNKFSNFSWNSFPVKMRYFCNKKFPWKHVKPFKRYKDVFEDANHSVIFIGTFKSTSSKPSSHSILFFGSKYHRFHEKNPSNVSSATTTRFLLLATTSGGQKVIEVGHFFKRFFLIFQNLQLKWKILCHLLIDIILSFFWPIFVYNSSDLWHEIWIPLFEIITFFLNFETRKLCLIV